MFVEGLDATRTALEVYESTSQFTREYKRLFGQVFTVGSELVIDRGISNVYADLDLAKYRAVSIWCKRFSVNFGAAALRPTSAIQNHQE